VNRPGVWRAILVCAAIPSLAGSAAAQARGMANLAGLVQSLSVSGRVLMIGAHPDDEDTQLITWLATGRHVETAYLSLTRGDGGQNLLGNELGEALGAIRTEELLAARRLDGGRQYFTRAYDFGFSKNADESFAQWPHDSVLKDVITVIRAFRPHVIVAVFSGTPRDGHGQHQVSGIVAKEAYELSGDTVRFPRSATRGLGPWTAQKFYRRTRQEPATLSVNVGEYDPLLGRSYGELADLSRSQHKSQAFGSLERKGVRMDGVRLEASRVAASGAPESSLFDGIDTTWARFRGEMHTAIARAALDSLPAAFVEARARFDAFAPEKVVPALANLQRLMGRICPEAEGMNVCAFRGLLNDGGREPPADPDLIRSLRIAEQRTNDALVQATGVALEATAPREVWALGDSVRMSITLYNRGRLPANVQSVSAAFDGVVTDAKGAGTSLLPDSLWSTATVGVLRQPTRPAWLELPRTGAMFTPGISGMDESLQRTRALAVVDVTVGNATVSILGSLVYRYADLLKGEVDKPVAGAPAIAVLLDHEVEYAQANSPLERAVRVHVTSAASQSRDVDVTLKLPNGLVVDSATRRVTLPTPGSQRTLTFNVRGRLPVGRHIIEAVASSGGQTFNSGYTAIEYDHIRTQRLYRPSKLGIEAVDLKLPSRAQVAYIAGVGDNVAPALEQLGVAVVNLDPSLLSRIDLSRFSAVVVGSRAYEANPGLVANNASLLDYVRNGGTAVVQYGQTEMQRPGMLPYPITLAQPADRVTVETAPVRITDPGATVLNAPNKISEKDFTGWQQDLSLYMPRTFDPRYATMLEVNDPGEPPNKGGILVAPYGKGTYVYTTLAFFRQLPNGVPGAARLFINLLAAKAERVVQ
jgi:LmbE family N-acetylglucosaminyl deacetylase